MLQSPRMIAASFMRIGVTSLDGGLRGHSIPRELSIAIAGACSSFRDASQKLVGGSIEDQPFISASLSVPVGAAPIPSGQDVNQSRRSGVRNAVRIAASASVDRPNRSSAASVAKERSWRRVKASSITPLVAVIASPSLASN